MAERNERSVFLLKAAELQFRLASAVRLAVSFGKQPLDLPKEWTHGSHRVRREEVALTPKRADFSAFVLQRSATYIMAVQIRNAIVQTVTDPKNDANPDIRNAYQISRMIRNAFAHRPLDPVWSIDADCRDQLFEVKGILCLDTHSLDGKPFDWRHYGGPLALFRLSEFVRTQVLGDDGRGETEGAPTPGAVYIQQGNLVFERVDAVPEGARLIWPEKDSNRA